MKTLIVIDMQNDFIDGTLGTPQAQLCVDKVAAKIKQYKENNERVIFTRDTHYDDYLDTPEGKKLPVVHCVKGTTGWKISPMLDTSGCEIIDKPSFGFTEWGKYSFDEIEIVGLCTDICVVSNALILKALFPFASISVDSSCCAGVTPSSHEAALTTMKMCQIDIK